MPEQRHARVHLCGNIPLADPEAVFRAVSEMLAAYVVRIPDGETGERSSRIGWLASRFLHRQDLEVVADPAASHGPPKVRPRPGVDVSAVGFGQIGYADAARGSWRTFRRLREEGVIPAGCRMQVGLPTPMAVIGSYVAEGQSDLEPAYEAALLGELDEIMATVPHDSLAVQWDTAIEFALLEQVLPAWFEDPEEEIVRQLLRIGAFVPEDVPLGYHLCYGHPRPDGAGEPGHAGNLVAVANRLTEGLTRSLDWLHLPVPRERADHGYFAPLAELHRGPQTQLYLGLVHLDDGLEGAQKRVAAATPVAREFGVATECGFGQLSPEQVLELLRLHAEVADAVGG